jgi:AmmeMemoRadiSam system protein A
MNPDFLSLKDQQELLTIARRVLEVHLKGPEGMLQQIRSNLPNLQSKRGAFVSLYTLEDLRGCVGHVFSDRPLFETVKEVAIAAATEDYRFSSIRFEELKETFIEISVLSAFQKLKQIDEIEIGKHGLRVSYGRSHGILLPQVATEYAWDPETFLSHTCVKAGLAPETWKHSRTLIEIFSAQVFGEKELLQDRQGLAP